MAVNCPRSFCRLDGRYPYIFEGKRGGVRAEVRYCRNCDMVGMGNRKGIYKGIACCGECYSVLSSPRTT